ncbi:alpha/beta fold hydrolase [Aquabacterium sp.]|uniref:alpha/beta fold hydrolase n=1 Tax=Aquabacterium sp. TaxID=1872578 RepID=UPI002C186E19|nr:alpha/beta hydrolase [Aquabacterium sp.]HSW03694.1 alpha/beta hydrolase [Aquabacterium sp.]
MNTTPPGLPNPAVTPPRPTLVLLHASAASARQWDALAESLKSRFDVQALDLHGHGKRPAPDHGQPLRVLDDVALARAVLERSGGGHVIGHSYGAAVAVHLAAAAPGLVHSLAVYEPVVFRLLADHARGSPGASEAFELATGVWEHVRQSRLIEAAALFVDYWSGPGTWHAMPPERQQAVAARMPLIDQQFLALMQEPLPASVLARLRMPLLCLHGTRSTLAARQMATLLQTLLPQGRHEALEDLGHMAPVTQALGVNHRLIRFLNVELRSWHAPVGFAA